MTELREEVTWAQAATIIMEARNAQAEKGT
jgi:hypothetical protein